MNLEEILVKLGFSGTELDQGLRKASVGLKDFGTHASEHMDKAAKSGRALHRLLDGIGEISPGVGLALTACFSGPMAALELVKLGLGAIKHHFEEIKKAAAEAEAAQERAFKATGDPRERARTVRREVSERTRERGYAPGTEEEQGLKEIEAKRAAIEKGANTLEEANTREKATREAALKAQAELEEQGAKRSDAANFEDIKKLYDVVDAHQALVDKIKSETEAQNKRRDALEEMTQTDKDRLDAAKEFERMAEEGATKSIARKKKERQEDEALEKFEDEWAEHAYKVQRELTDKKRELHRLEQAPYTPGLSELAKQNTPYGELARLVQMREGQAKLASGYASPQELAALQGGVQANTAQLRSDLAASGGNPLAVKAALERSGEGLRKMFGEHGNDPHLQALEKTREGIKELADLAKHDGLIVKPAPDQ